MTTCWKCNNEFDPNDLRAVGVVGQCRSCTRRSQQDRAVAQIVAESPDEYGPRRGTYAGSVVFYGQGDCVDIEDIDRRINEFVDKQPLDKIPFGFEFPLPAFPPIELNLNIFAVAEEWRYFQQQLLSALQIPSAYMKVEHDENTGGSRSDPTTPTADSQSSAGSNDRAANREDA